MDALTDSQEILTLSALVCCAGGKGRIKLKNLIYFITSSEFNAYLKQIKAILSAVKKYRIFSLVMNTIYIFSL